MTRTRMDFYKLMRCDLNRTGVVVKEMAEILMSIRLGRRNNKTKARFTTLSS